MLTYTQDDHLAILTLDDGKANAVGHDFIAAVNEGLDRATSEAQAVLFVGRSGVFSGGFDLKEIQKGPDAANALVTKGAHMLLRLFTHPQPVVVASTGHAVAAGAFFLLASDTRIGSAGDFRIGLNETAIGMTLPVFGIQLAHARLSKRHQTQCVVQSELLGPQDAVDAGFLDAVAEPDALLPTAIEQAKALGELPAAAYAKNKLDMRATYIAAIEASLA